MTRWNILHLAAIENGESIWPETFPLEKLEDIRRQMGSALFETMYMGRPEALTGDIFKPQWFRSCAWGMKLNPLGHPTPHLVYEGNGEKVEIPRDRLLVYQFWDLAISQKETADYTCCVTLALDPETMNLFVLDVVRGHWSFAQTQEQIASQGILWNPVVVGIESVAYQAAAVQMAVNSTLLPIREVRVDRDKVSRARLPAARAESGKMFVLPMPWAGAFIDECAAFPTGAHDDQVDALSGACAIAAQYVRTSIELWGS